MWNWEWEHWIEQGTLSGTAFGTYPGTGGSQYHFPIGVSCREDHPNGVVGNEGLLVLQMVYEVWLVLHNTGSPPGGHVGMGSPSYWIRLMNRS
jgi:hypothetical protein